MRRRGRRAAPRTPKREAQSQRTSCAVRSAAAVAPAATPMGVWTRPAAVRRDTPGTTTREAQSQHTSCAVRRAAAVASAAAPSPCAGTPLTPQHGRRNLSAHLVPSGELPLSPQPQFPWACWSGAAAVRGSWRIRTRPAALRRDTPDTPTRVPRQAPSRTVRRKLLAVCRCLRLGTTCHLPAI